MKEEKPIKLEYNRNLTGIQVPSVPGMEMADLAEEDEQVFPSRTGIFVPIVIPRTHY